MSTDPGLVEFVDLRRVAEDGTRLLDGVALTIEAGSWTAILGPPGSGKTVLLRAMAALDPLQGGEIRLHGRALMPNRVPAYRRQVAYLHQRSVLLEGSVRGNLELPFHLRSADGRSFDDTWVVERLERVGRNRSFLERTVADLSGGESQIVALLRVLQLQPQVVLLDEPSASLDEATASALESLVIEWRDAQPDRALVLVTHNRGQANRLTQTQLHLHSGRLSLAEGRE